MAAPARDHPAHPARAPALRRPVEVSTGRNRARHRCALVATESLVDGMPLVQATDTTPSAVYNGWRLRNAEPDCSVRLLPVELR